MNKGILIVCLLLLTSCSMSREETIEAVKTCEEAGMEAKLTINIWHKVLDVNCLPKQEDKQDEG